MELSQCIQGDIWVIETLYQWFCCRRKSKTYHYYLHCYDDGDDEPWLMTSICQGGRTVPWKILVSGKIQLRIFCVDQREYILSLFTLMLTIQFVLYSLHTCYVSPKGQVLFLIKPCISVLHKKKPKKLLFK